MTALPWRTAHDLDPLDGWREMTTAPTDGSDILIRFGQDHVSQAWYVDDPNDPYPWKFIDRNGDRRFINGVRDDRYGPTHWQPMPSAILAPKPGSGE